MTRIARDPLSGVSRLLVDATNLLHQMSRSTERVPAAALVGRLRAAIPAEIAIELVFDGPPERGLKGERIASGVSVRYGGRFSADTILITLVEDAAMAGGPAAEGILVVSDDRALRSAVGMRGGRTIGAAWLLARLSRPRLAAPSVGNGRPPLRPAMEQEAAATARWAPGRGATRKVGNAKRRPRAGGG